MHILSEDGKALINFNNIIALDIHKNYQQYSYLDTTWTIRATCAAISDKNPLQYNLMIFEDENSCKNTFDKLCDRIANAHPNEIINMKNI